MKVLYVDISIGFGGAFKSLALAFRGLTRVDKTLMTTQDPDLVHLWFPGVRSFAFRRRINYRTREQIETSRLPRPLRWVGFKLFAVADRITIGMVGRQVRRIIRAERPDIVHLNNWFIPEVQAAARLEGVPCVVHVRDVVTADSVFELRWALDAAAVVGVSDAVRESLRRRGVPEEKLRRIYDPVDVAAVDRGLPARERIRVLHGVADTQLAMGIFGRVTAWKGQEEFVRASIEAMKVVPNLTAFIVGDQTDTAQNYFDRVRGIIAESGVADRFVLTGYRPNVEEYYAAMDVLVHASTTPEPFGMVVIEGMAASLPVIATAGGGPLEVVSPGDDGLLVPMGDVAALRDAMVALARDPGLRRRLGAAGRAKAEGQFSVTAHAASVAAVYDAVLRER